MICQATIPAGGFTALDVAAGWCDQEAVTTVPVNLVSNVRYANVWLCPSHLAEFERAMDA